MSSALRRLFLCALTSLPLLVGTTFAYADDVEEDETEEEADDEATTTITIDGGYADTDPSAVTVYNTELQPYGVWVSDARYGTVWVPNQADVGVDFAPYQSAGHWELTADDEWLWVSDYSWGYIPFHYGRWVWIEQTGWAWIPGRAYAPAWVVWRTGASGYIGWAPMPPAYYWMGGVYHTCSPPVAAYVFVSTTYVYDVHVHSHIYRERADVERAVKGTEQHHHQSGTPHYGPSQPSPQEAHVTPPTSRAKVDSKALDLAKPKATTSSASKGNVSVAKPKKATQAKSGSAPKPTTVSRPTSTAVVSKPTAVVSKPTTTRSSGTTSTSTPTVTKRTTKRSTKAVTAPSTPRTVTVTTPASPRRTVTRTVTPKPAVSTPKTTSTPKPASPTPRPVVVSKPSTSTPAPAARKSSPTVTRRSHKR